MRAQVVSERKGGKGEGEKREGEESNVVGTEWSRS